MAITKQQLAEYIKVNLTADDLISLLKAGALDDVLAKPSISIPKVARKAPNGKKPSNGKSQRKAASPSIKKAEIRLTIDDNVLDAFKSGDGRSSSDVAEELGCKQSKVALVIKKLKSEKKLFQGGQRRFARYATTQLAADEASVASRNGG